MWRSRTTALRDRLVSSDPGLTRLRLAFIALGNLILTVGTLSLLGAPLPAIIVASVAGMQATFMVNDHGDAAQALTLLLVFVLGCAVMSVAALTQGIPLLPEAVFLVVIFGAVYAQRFGPRGTALGATAFFLFFFSIFLRFTIELLPEVIGAVALGLAGNALMRFGVLRRRPTAELLRVRRAFRARLARLVAAITDVLENGIDESPAGPHTDARARRGMWQPGRWQRRQLRRLITRLHECGLMIEEVLGTDTDPDTEVMLRRRVVEVELAAERLLRAAWHTDTGTLTARDRAGLVGRLRELHDLIERDPAELPVISNTEEFADMLVTEPSGDHPERSWPLYHAIGQLAVADAEAQRLVQRELDQSPTEARAERDDEEEQRGSLLDDTAKRALQALVAGALAIAGGELVSTHRWYWAVITVFVVFIGTTSRGTMFVKGFRRLAGTVWGIAGGLGAALLAAGSPPAAITLIGVCVFGLVYVARVSQGLVAFFITTALGLLYSLLGTFSFDVLVLRLTETAVGVVAGMLAALVIVPIRTRQVLADQVCTVLDELREFLHESNQLLSGTENVNLIERSRSLDREIGTLRGTVEPFTHPFNLYRSRRQFGWYILAALETCAFCARDLAVRAEPALLSEDDRLAGTIDRVTGNLDRVAAAVRDEPDTAYPVEPSGPLSTSDDRPGVRVVLDSLERLDSSVLSVARALGRTEPLSGRAQDQGHRTGD